MLEAAAELIDSGRLKPTVSRILSPINASNLRLAHEKVLAGDMIGKLVLEGF